MTPTGATCCFSTNTSMGTPARDLEPVIKQVGPVSSPNCCSRAASLPNTQGVQCWRPLRSPNKDRKCAHGKYKRESMIRFGRDVCDNLNEALRREWLETNGLGGFASSTIIGLNTRRYHGLLVAATKPPVGRFVLLSKLEETVILGGERFVLSANQYAGAIHPNGYLYLESFRAKPFPVFTYRVAGIQIEKSVFVVHG